MTDAENERLANAVREIDTLRALCLSLTNMVTTLQGDMTRLKTDSVKTISMLDKWKDVLLGAALTGFVGMLMYFGLPVRGSGG